MALLESQESRENPALRAVLGRRICAFVGVFTILPGIGSVLAGLLGSSRLGALWEPLQADPLFAVRSVLQPVLASTAIACGLAVASLAIWPRNVAFVWVRACRLLLCLCFVGLLLYPAFGATLPIVRTVPFWATALALFVLTAASFAIPRARSGVREWLFVAALCGGFLFNPTPVVSSSEFQSLARRELNAKDIVIIGFDSLSHSDVAAVLDNFKPKTAGKVVYENATTPYASTGPSWRAIFSGSYPDPLVLPGDRWGRSDGKWLPDELVQRGYSVHLLQDDPSTNIFSSAANIRIWSNQGWKWISETLLWRSLFPLSELAASWLLDAVGGPADFSSRHAYNPKRFQEGTLRHIAKHAALGSVAVASHTCFAHTPIHLRREEVWALDRWWTMKPAEFEGGVSYFTKQEHTNYKMVADARTANMRKLLNHVLERLEEVGVIGKAMVFIVSDHGARASWITSRQAHNVMLAAFHPEGGGSARVAAPVSLVDLAPTIRARLQLPEQKTDGEVLPLGGQGKMDRVTKQMTSASIRTGAKVLLKPETLGLQGNVIYNQDGTFSLSDHLRRQLREIIEREDRIIKTIQHLVEGARPPEAGTREETR